MQLNFGLIIVIAAQAASPFKLNCVNYVFEPLNNYAKVSLLKPNRLSAGILIYKGEGSEKLEVLEDLMKRGNESFIVIDRAVRTHRIGAPPGTYVIAMNGDDVEFNVNHAISQLVVDECNWNPKTRMLFVLPVEGEMNNFVEIASTIISTAWKWKAFETAVIFETPGNKEDIFVFTANPFHRNNNCGKKAKTVVPLIFCGTPSSQLIRHKLLWKRRQGYFNCTLKVSRRESPPFSYKNFEGWRGVDNRFVTVFSARFGLKMQWSKRPNPGAASSVEETHHYFKQLMRGELDMAIGGSVMVEEWYFKVEYLRTHSQQYLGYYTAAPTYIRDLEVVLHMFSMTVWYLLTITIFFGGIVLSILWEGRLDIRETRFLVLVAILYTQTIKFPKRWSIRLYLVFFLFGLLHMSILQSSSIQSYTISPPRRRQMTLNDIIKSKTPIYVTPTDYHLLNNESYNYKHLSVSNLPIPENLFLLNRNRNFSVLSRSLSTNFWRLSTRQQIHELEEKEKQLYICMVMTRGSIYSEFVNDYISRVREGGIFLKWLNDLTEIRKNPPITSIKTAVIDPLVIKDILGVFYILISGYVIAIVVFLSEIYLPKVNSSHN